MLPLITTKIKDDTLQWLCVNVRPGRLVQIDMSDMLNTVNIDFDTLNAVLYDFEELDLIESLNMRRTATFLILKVRAHDFFRQGGFAVIDALTEANIQKLLYEIESLAKQLKPDQLDTFNKIASIASAVATVAAAFSNNK